MGGGEGVSKIARQFGEAGDEGCVELGDIALVLEIERRLDLRRQPEQPFAPVLDLARQRAARNTQRGAALQLGLGRDQVGQAFDLQQVDLSVGEGAAGELARLGEAEARERRQLGIDRVDDSATAVELQNPNILLSSGAPPTFATIKPADLNPGGLAINNYKPTTSTQYSAGIQHSFGPKTVLSSSYVGNVNRHLNDYRNINLPSLAELPLVDTNAVQYTATSTLPYKGFRHLNMAQNEANGHYNSLQIDLNSQFSKDLQLRAYYTLSRSIDPSTGGSGQDLNAVTNPYLGWRYDLGPSLFDRTHNFSANFIYDIPVLRSSSSRILKSTLGGWQVSGIITIVSGLPVNINDTTPIANDVVGNGNRPDLTGKIRYTHQVVGPQKILYIDPAAFTSVASAGTFGNLGHNALRGPGRDNWNLSLFKTFAFTETSGLQIRLESFNTFNHTQFQNVNNNFGQGTFGQFTSAYPARIIQLAGKVYF